MLGFRRREPRLRSKLPVELSYMVSEGFVGPWWHVAVMQCCEAVEYRACHSKYLMNHERTAMGLPGQ